MQLTINLTTEQYKYLVTEANKTASNVEQVIQQLIDIQIEVQREVEADMTLDLWSDDVLGSTVV